jgi:hypothetical protein
MARTAGPHKIKKNLYLEEHICALTELYLTQAGESSPSHGAWSAHIETLMYAHWKNLHPELRTQILKQKEKKDQKCRSVLNGLLPATSTPSCPQPPNHQ